MPAVQSERERRERRRKEQFYRNLLLLIVALAILIPLIFAVVQSVRLSKAKKDQKAQTEQIEALQKEKAELTEKVNKYGENGAMIDADGPAYQSMFPDFYAPQRLNATEDKENTAYLTFDDGPSANTDIILQTLAEENVKATFFVIGQTGEEDLARMRRIAEQGHTLAMHSYSHVYNDIYESVEAYLTDMNELFQLIKETTGVTPSCFRFPGGSVNSYNMSVYKEIMAEMLRRGFVPFDWNVSSCDATGEEFTPDQLAQNVLQGIDGCRRGIILMHDAAQKESTAQAVRQIIVGLREKGFSMEALTCQTKPVLFGYSE